MADSATRRQEIYDKIKESSKDQYILEEMKRLGFWNEGEVDFETVNQYFKEENELSGKLQKLLREKRLIENPETFLAQKHKERKLASKQSQKETKERREKLRQEKADRWKQSKEKDIIFLGEGYSHTLHHKSSNPNRLRQAKLPVLHNAEDIAKAMGISIGQLRFLSFSRKNSKISHYKRFKIPKKTGGFRLISAPQPKLKEAQHWILENVLNKVTVHPKAHGCVVGRSIKTNALPHVRQDVVINQDLKNFFPSIVYSRIKGVFQALGYSNQVATIFALICSEPKIVEVSVLGENYYAQRGERFLPQGSPCSPAITNILCRKLDYRLDGLARKYGFNYTRYVDDLTFSGGRDQYTHITNILKYSNRVVKEENFTLHPDKLRIMKKGVRQEVTGVVVNEKPNIDKKSLKRFRALLYQIEKDGLEGKVWTGKADILAQIHGYANFINQIDPEKGKKYKEQVDVILERYNYKDNHRKQYVKIDIKPKGLLGRLRSFFKK
ncbi:reverse transcriptase family protein [Aquimarina sp. 2201CG5-10]|uniref:reverse transcriptase family protein n=1 Tax=Aquimarina callyspongiae TaxID=3098150 RepID=UPI002AB39836|nr:reverse transcriptase family protein [Aquimarina sp. 2201CG5-10]MDY8135075.1 reverse transcriptase family protein [Aquimarina sp. 2201CG5-10]